MEKELLKYCRYYHGERECPHAKYYKRVLWGCEKYYFENFWTRTDGRDHKHWEGMVAETTRDYPAFKDILSRDYPIEVKGMIVFTVLDLEYHAPYSLRYLLKYGE